MANKPKKAKTPKAPKAIRGNGAGKDPVTGLTLEADSVTIISDKKYQQTFADALKTGAFGLESIYPIQYEVEISPSLIAFTIVQSPGDPGVYRGVMKGDFQIRNNKVVNARIEEFAQRGRFSDGQGGFYENGSTYAVNQSASKTFSTPFKASEWGLVLSNGLVERGWFSDSGSQGGVGKQAVTSFGNGQLLQDGWWQDPFTPNLI